MDHQLQAVAQGIPSLPCILPFIMGCLVKDARAVPVAQIWTGEPAILPLPEDTLHLPLVARLLIDTEDDGPLASVPTQGDASSDTKVKAIDPNSIETAAQSEPPFTVEERPGSVRSLPTFTADDGPGTARVIATLSRDDSSGRVLPTDVPGVQQDSTSAVTNDQTKPDFPVDDGPGTAKIVAILTRDGTSARSLPTDAASVPEDDVNPVDNNYVKLRVWDSGMTLSSVYLMLG